MKHQTKSFSTHAINKFQLRFPNGNWISTIWNAMTYCDNFEAQRLYPELPLTSNTVEIMFTCPKELEKQILDKYADGYGNPIGYLNITQWLEIVNLLAK